METVQEKQKDLVQFDLPTRVNELEKQVAELKENAQEDKVSLILFSGDFDKAIATMMMALGAVGMGMECTIYCTFWGVSVIKRKRFYKGKSLLGKMMTWMLPANSHGLNPSQMAFGPFGRKLFRYMMKGKFESLEGMLQQAIEAGVKFQICSPSMSMMEFNPDEWIVPPESAEICGVAAMYEVALKAKTAYFIS